ncbi:MAG: hypothetical protein E6626_06815 [Flavonifractor plautii]|nr:hypothetical protein [Flavonifractor plautii]MDU6290750.1 hypothetical protein [Flavonifractor plautii]MDU6343351.1 hypothetical protein [Flavonifractor plautii]
MSDLRLLALVLSGGFLFLGGIFWGQLLGCYWGNVLLAIGLILLLIPIPLGCIHFFRWFAAWDPFPQSQAHPSDNDKGKDNDPK